MDEAYRPVIDRLRIRANEHRDRFMRAAPFRYVIINNFLPEQLAERILASYPQPGHGWDGTAYIHQLNKFVLSNTLPRECQEFFALCCSPEFMRLLSEITAVDKLIFDPELLGGGLHQISRGGFLDVHVDFNKHPHTKLHRRLNLLFYLNKSWKREYEGYLELWDMERKECFERIAPDFNRCVIFETNEISYHGHPRPLQTPPGVMRKSLSVYYYTAERDAADLAVEHNTVYRATEGLASYLKVARSASLALRERLREKKGMNLAAEIASRVFRIITRTPPPNK